MADKNELEPEDAQDSKEGEGEIPTLTVRLTRVVRTPASEVYLLWDEDTRLGQVDLHFGTDLIHATLILERELSSEQQADIVDQIDQEVVSSHLPRFGREDFLVTVFQGRELEPFSDGPDEDDFDDDEDY
ncbi:hypothetical protein IAD21_01317 [Abditibacteriota bacterium]|nr:hypothetical protein IAD21_01317 [Abditibacteriota bacterium]